jgi:DNA polymerase I
MLFSPDVIGAYLDWRTQEIGMAAALSGDQALMDAYRSGDIYHRYALEYGLTTEPDRIKWKKAEPEIRDQMKKLSLAINYGMGVPSLARGLNRHPSVASAIIEQHKRNYTPFWEWRSQMVETAILKRKIESVFGWPLRISHSPNRRTLYNFPMQAGGAEMLRLAAWRMCEAGIVPIMLIHDGILLEEANPEKIEYAKEIMLQAGRDVCDGFEIGVDTDQMLVGGARYYDKRPVAKKLWATMMETLELVGAILKKDVA